MDHYSSIQIGQSLIEKRAARSSDVYPPSVRSRVMRSVRSRNNKSTELFFVQLLRAYSIHGWRRHYPALGKPDFVFLPHRIAIFIDGCFWHGHNCRNTTPKQNSMYWEKKINRNKQRDKQTSDRFKDRGWTVIRIWECQLSSESTIRMLAWLRNLVQS